MEVIGRDCQAEYARVYSCGELIVMAPDVVVCVYGARRPSRNAMHMLSSWDGSVWSGMGACHGSSVEARSDGYMRIWLLFSSWNGIPRIRHFVWVVFCVQPGSRLSVH